MSGSVQHKSNLENDGKERTKHGERKELSIEEIVGHKKESVASTTN